MISMTADISFSTAPEWVRIPIAARLAGGVSKRTIRRWIGAGFIRASKPASGIVLVERDSLLRLIEDAARGRHV